MRKSNVCMISKRDATVSGSQEVSDAAGKRSEMAHQLAIMAKALKRDMEEALCQKGAKATGSASVARKTGGFENWIESNESRGTGGSSAGDGAAVTDGTQRALTETLLKDVLQSCFSNGGEPSLAICGPVNKQKISGFTGRSSARQMIDANTVEASVSIYSSDFGELQIVPSNRSRERSLLLVDPEFAKVAYLRNFQTVDIATIPLINDASPTNFVAVITPLVGSILTLPTFTSSKNVAVCATPRVPVVVKPLIFAFPIASIASVGTDVPIPTSPFAFTTKLSLSTCTPFLKLNDFLIFAIIISFRVIYRIIFAQVRQPCQRVP